MISQSSCFAILGAETRRPTMDIRFLVGAALHLVIDASRPWMWEGESPQ